MKPIYFGILFTLFFISSACLPSGTAVYSQTKSGTGFYSGGHDTLLLDGADVITTVPTNRTKDCKIMVTYAYGSVEGTFYKTETYTVCGPELFTDTIFVKGALIQNYVLKLGEDITTGDNSNLELEFYDGSIIRMGPNSKIKISGDMCDRRTLIEQVGGKIWTNVKKLLGSQKYEVKTERNGGGARGTKFSIEITNDEEIIRVYEGSFEVYPPGYNIMSGNDEKELATLAIDYQAGKITMEEFVQKSQEYTKNLNKQREKMKTKMCEAGYMVKVTDKISDPIPIESTGSEWFDDINFKK